MLIPYILKFQVPNNYTMSFEATLTVDDKTFKVITFNYSSNRDHDRFGRPTSQLYGFRLELTIEHNPDCVQLHNWAYNNHEVRSGRITFMQRTSLQRQTEIRFSDGYIVKIGTSFTNEGELPMVEKLVICAGSFEYESQGNVTVYESGWPESGT